VSQDAKTHLMEIPPSMHTHRMLHQCMICCVMRYELH